jgi:molybdopterin synthase sulfur carrier subunit
MTTVNVLYFARLREAFGVASEQVHLPDGVMTAAGLLDFLRGRGEAWARELADGRPYRIAVNQDMAVPETALREGDEVAVFPPVTGG